MSGEYNRASGNDGDDLPDEQPSIPNSPVAPADTPAGHVEAPDFANNGNNIVPNKQVEEVMQSDIGITTLLDRLKQSIASARDFATFLKKRSSLEEEQATGLKRLVRAQMDSLRRIEVRSGSYAQQLNEVMRLHDRMGDNGMQFALSLHQMHEDLSELAGNMERGRKQWKHEGLDAEKRASDAETAMQKAKSRYDGLAEDYDRARTGDTKGARRIGLKGPKSAEQYEQDLLRKVQTADADYEEKVRVAQQQRQTLLSSDRPKAVKALAELIKECDSALALQLQKFAAFNEKLLLGNGLAITPLVDKDSPTIQRSLRDIIYDIDNEGDFTHYVRGRAGKIPARAGEIVYEKHPTLAPKVQQPNSRNVTSTFQGPSQTERPPQQLSAPLGVTTVTGVPPSQPNSVNTKYGPPQTQPPQSGYPHAQNQPPTNQLPPSSNWVPSQGQHPQQQYNTGAPPRDGFGGGGYPGAPAPYPVHPSERTGGGSGYPPQQGPPSMGIRQFSNPASPAQRTLPPLRPTFGVSLDELFERDESAVPVIVIQCILAVDTFGLEVEGIYRLSGTASHIHTLKSQFDHNAAQVDFRNPAAFFHDVNSVATLLKQFFRDLPDPLFTRAAYDAFIEAAKTEGDDQRRDALHQIINDLPDANYATLRALVLHLHHVIQNESRNRMGASNLALCFAPSLMGTHTGAQIADASLQARVVDTILSNATAIFDED